MPPCDVAYAPGSITTSRVAGSELQGLLRKALVGSTGAICRSSRRSQAADPARRDSSLALERHVTRRPRRQRPRGGAAREPARASRWRPTP